LGKRKSRAVVCRDVLKNINAPRNKWINGLAPKTALYSIEVNNMKITAGGVLYKNQSVLLAQRSIHRNYYPGVWDIVGGHSLADETPDQTLCREMREELGIVPTIYTELGVFPEPNPKQYGKAEHHVYVVTEWDGNPFNAAKDEHECIGWFTKIELPTLQLASPSYIKILEHLFTV
jgi:8-oxo-dGTP diphosphatase